MPESLITIAIKQTEGASGGLPSSMGDFKEMDQKWKQECKYLRSQKIIIAKDIFQIWLALIKY